MTNDTNGSDRRRAFKAESFWALVNRGPLLLTELPGGSPDAPQRQKYDMRTFDVGGVHGTRTVAYLGRYHDEARVLRAWLAFNRENLIAHDVTKYDISYHLGKPFSGVWDELKGAVDWLPANETALQ